jgi:hypothetical protein
MTVKVGQIVTYDYQSDPFGGQYVIVAKVEGKRNVWLVENLEPTDAILDEIDRTYRLPGMYLGIFDPFGPARRDNTVEEAIEAEVNDRIERTGHRSEVTFVSQAQFNRAF